MIVWWTPQSWSACCVSRQTPAEAASSKISIWRTSRWVSARRACWRSTLTTSIMRFAAEATIPLSATSIWRTSLVRSPNTVCRLSVSTKTPMFTMFWWRTASSTAYRQVTSLPARLGISLSRISSWTAVSYCRKCPTSTIANGSPIQRWSVCRRVICLISRRGPNGATWWASNWRVCSTPI